MTPKQRFLAVCRGEPYDRTPVTPLFMQWAAHHIGRSYRDYYLHGELVAEAQLAVARDLHMDMLCAISDPWTESSGYGMAFDYPEEATGVPREYLIQSRDDVDRLPALDLDAGRPAERLKALRLMREAMGRTHPVVGWVEGPIAQYCDLRGLQEAMLDLMDEPGAYHRAAEHLVGEAVRFGAAQAEAGADAIGVGDAAASMLGPAIYREHILPWQRRLIAGLQGAGALVKLHICGDIRAILPEVLTAGADIVDLDWMVPIADARALAGDAVTLAGNFDPAAVLLHGTPERVAAAAERCRAEAGDRFMLQPGCEVPPGTPIENLKAFCPGETAE